MNFEFQPARHKSGCLVLLVHAIKCGQEFREIAVVFEPDGENPLIRVDKPLGIQAVKEIIEQVEDFAEMKK